MYTKHRFPRESLGRMFSSVHLHPTSSGAQLAFRRRTRCGFWRSESCLQSLVYGGPQVQNTKDIKRNTFELKRPKSIVSKHNWMIHVTNTIRDNTQERPTDTYYPGQITLRESKHIWVWKHTRRFWTQWRLGTRGSHWLILRKPQNGGRGKGSYSVLFL